ncbi:MAG: NAD(P)H-dependent glycerol-3-phosphate dehydrogenase, partial [Candidatus Thorarchaeota archaeon]|jgi:glycerol-3-phosphate dehydrogenase (NAD(P)+)
VIWAKDGNELAKAQNILNKNPKYRSEHLALEIKYNQPLSTDDVIIVAVPSAVIRQLSREIAEFQGGRPLTIVSASKGLEQPGFKTMSQVLTEELPQCRIGVLTGPTIAWEVGEGKRTKAVLAAYDVACLMRLKNILDTPSLLFELSLDPVAIEFCAALKGVIAIGTGIADSLELGRNFMGLLLTYGLHEFITIGRFLGISTNHVLSIAGLGDLITTAWSTQSRNYKFGRLLAQEVPMKDALKEVGMVVEGVRVARDVAQLARLNVSVDIFSAIAAIIDNPTEENLANFVKVILEYRSMA